MPEADSVSGLTPHWKLWLEHDGRYVFGRGAFLLLRAIQDTGSLTAAAQRVGMSYRYAWGIIRKVERELGAPVVETHRGGAVGGGGTSVTPVGARLIRAFSLLDEAFQRTAAQLQADLL